MPREVVVLGTASQAPTRERNHNGYLLRWDALGLLFDPGEGTQRQLLLASERTSTISHVLITHEHGDHTLGLPGVIQAMSLHRRDRPVVLVHPEPAGAYLDRILAVDLYDSDIEVQRVPLPADRTSRLALDDDTTLIARPLSHRVPTLGYRVQEADSRSMDPTRLAAAGLHGPAVGELQRQGVVQVDGRTVRLEDVSDPRPGQAMAFAMDTRRCDGLTALLAGCDLAVVESTFQSGDETLADTYGHLTAGQAGAAAADAGVRRLVLSHYSQRYPDTSSFQVEAALHHDDVVAATDLSRVEVPSRHRPRRRTT